LHEVKNSVKGFTPFQEETVAGFGKCGNRKLLRGLELRLADPSDLAQEEQEMASCRVPNRRVWLHPIRNSGVLNSLDPAEGRQPQSAFPDTVHFFDLVTKQAKRFPEIPVLAQIYHFGLALRQKVAGVGR
jgi:hypothetical protein